MEGCGCEERSGGGNFRPTQNRLVTEKRPLSHRTWEFVRISSFAFLSLGVMEQAKGHGRLGRNTPAISPLGSPIPLKRRDFRTLRHYP